MVGIVVVSHSHKLAEGIREVATQMAQNKVVIATAGGLDESTIGTNVERILNAINKAYSPDGVLVLMDLGSAVLSTKMAIEMLPPEKQRKILLSEAPIVEGTISAAVEASIGSPLEKVDTAARQVVTKAKVEENAPLVETEQQRPEPQVGEGNTRSIEITLTNELGLHARPAAMLVQQASKFKSRIQIEKDDRKANAKSIVEVLSLGAERGDKIKIIAEGEDSAEALKSLEELVKSNFGEDAS